MKKLLMLMAVVGITSAAQAEQMCADIPAGLKFDSMDSNFDGSVTVRGPKVSVGGKLVRVGYYSSGNNNTKADSASGVCALIGKVSVTSTGISSRDSGVLLTASGKLNSLPLTTGSNLWEVLCQ